MEPSGSDFLAFRPAPSSLAALLPEAGILRLSEALAPCQPLYITGALYIAISVPFLPSCNFLDLQESLAMLTQNSGEIQPGKFQKS